MFKATRLLPLSLIPALILAAASLALAPSSAGAKQFTFDEKTNRQMARQLNIPVFFAVPDSARAPLPADITTPDRLIDFQHPDALKSNAKVGLRLIVAKRAGLARRLARSGLVQTGDILLTFRSEWGGVGPYPNVQMGISHTGIAYIRNGTVHNIDNPMDEEFIGSGRVTELNSKHYREIKLIHIIRPRNLTDAQRANLIAWATRLNAGAKRFFPKQVDFNQDYSDPKYKPGRPLSFVKHLGQIALGQNPSGTVDMFCSEFAWSLLALRDCAPDKVGDAFKGSGTPSCIRPAMKPMRATGGYVSGKSRNAYTGLGDGPLVVVAALKLPGEEREKMLKSVFTENPKLLSRLSSGHRDIAKQHAASFAKLEGYYRSALRGGFSGIKARLMSKFIGRSIRENYSPTSFLINTLLPPNSSNRTMDYVATIVMQ
jgi:hypothetical protein